MTATTKLDLENLNTLDWSKQNGLLPAIIQNQATGQILMQGYMSQEALQLTLSGKDVVFWSRSKNRLWKKGETSGNTLRLVEAYTDCDRDSLLILADPQGPTCHLDRDSCFDPSTTFDRLGWLENIIQSRKGLAADSSYTAKLLSETIDRVAKKVGEEGVEVAIAAAKQDDNELIDESSDLIYHLLVLLSHRGLTFSDVSNRLKQRHQQRQ